MNRSGVLLLALVVLAGCAKLATADLLSKFEAKISGKSEHVDKVLASKRVLLDDFESKLVAKVSGVHAKISGLRQAHDAEHAELLQGMKSKRVLLGDEFEAKLVAKVSGVHAKISGLRQAHDAEHTELLQGTGAMLAVMSPPKP